MNASMNEVEVVGLWGFALWGLFFWASLGLFALGVGVPWLRTVARRGKQARARRRFSAEARRLAVERLSTHPLRIGPATVNVEAEDTPAVQRLRVVPFPGQGSGDRHVD